MYRTNIFSSATPIVSVIGMFLPRILPSNPPLWQPLLVFVTKRKGNASRPCFSPLSYPITHSLDQYGFRSLDDDVAVTSVSRYMITESVLTHEPVQMQPVLSQRLV